MINISENIFKLGLAVALGLLIGFEREKSHKPAGIRTYILVSLGCTLVTIVSYEFFPEDPARITSGILTGIGFLGAGTIIAARKNIVGLTTAAGLWVMSIIGIAIGVGAYALAVITSIMVFLILIFGKIDRERIH